jgi:hypothetical protein
MSFSIALGAIEARGRFDQAGILNKENHPLYHMLESYQSGDFWVYYAAKRSWVFEKLHWAKVDRRFFGNGDLEDRLKLLALEERNVLDSFVQRKLVEKEERTLADWESKDILNEELLGSLGIWCHLCYVV